MQGGAGGAASVGFEAAAAMFNAVGQSNADRGAALVDQENARLSYLQGALNEDAIRRRGRAVQGEAIAALGAGEGVESQSAQDLIFQNSLEMEYASLSARYSAAGEARGYLIRSAQEKQAARMALIGGFLRAGAAAVTGISDARNTSVDDVAYNARYNSFFPGGQQLPMPVDLPSAQPVATLPGGF